MCIQKITNQHPFQIRKRTEFIPIFLPLPHIKMLFQHLIFKRPFDTLCCELFCGGLVLYKLTTCGIYCSFLEMEFMLSGLKVSFFFSFSQNLDFVLFTYFVKNFSIWSFVFHFETFLGLCDDALWKNSTRVIPVFVVPLCYLHSPMCKDYYYYFSIFNSIVYYIIECYLINNYLTIRKLLFPY